MFVRAIAAAALLLGSAQAAIIDIDSTTANNGVDLTLDAGTYDVTFVDGLYKAWNPWGRVRGCASDGTDCTNGWITSANVSSTDLGTIAFGRTGKYASADQALLEAASLTLTIAQRQTLTFFIGDSQFGDNTGGVSLAVNEAAVPLPAAGLLFGAGIAAFLRKRGQA